MLHGIELKGSSLQPINEIACFVSEEFLFLRVIFCLLTSGRSLWYCLGIIRIIDFHHVELVCGQCTPYCFWNYIQNLNGRENPWALRTRRLGKPAALVLSFFGGISKNMHMSACNQTEIKENMKASRFDQCWCTLLSCIVCFIFLLCYFQLGRPLIVVTCFVSNETVSTLSILSIPLLWRAKLMLPSFVICACPVYWNNILQRVRCQPSQCVTCVRQLTIDFWDRNLLHILSKYRKINKLRDQIKHRSRNQKSRNIRNK